MAHWQYVQCYGPAKYQVMKWEMEKGDAAAMDSDDPEERPYKKKRGWNNVYLFTGALCLYLVSGSLYYLVLLCCHMSFHLRYISRWIPKYKYIKTVKYASDARLHRHMAVSSQEEYSIISVQRLEDLMAPMFCWLDLAVKIIISFTSVAQIKVKTHSWPPWSLYTMKGPPI